MTTDMRADASMSNDTADAVAPVEVVSFAGVGVSFDGKETWALRDLDLVIRAGERWVVLGANGSGKTTLVRLITGYLHPTVGELALLGARLGHGVDWRVLRTRISVVSAAFAKMVRPQVIGRDLVMTAKYAALEPWWHTYDAVDAAKAQSLLDDAGFGYLGDREFSTMSEGERQQVQLARMLMAPPELVVLDEPAAGLDLGARERLIARLAAIAADPEVPAAVLVTHHLEEIPPAFTHALLLKGGTAVSCGPIGDAISTDAVSEAFDVPVTVDLQGGRFTARFR